MKSALLTNVLLLSTVTSAHTILHARETQQKREVTPWLRAESGNYELLVPSIEIGDKLHSLLDTLWSIIAAIIPDAEQSQSHPSAAYKTFFKDKANAPFVAQLLTNVTIGNAMYPPNPPGSSGHPTLIYVDENTPSMVFAQENGTATDAYELCKTVASRGAVAFVARRLPYIILCPDFFSSYPALPISKSCPRVTRHGTAFQHNRIWEPNYAGERMTHGQVWILLEEIVYYYLDYHWLTVQGPESEVRDINQVWELDAALSLGNAQTYVYYAAMLDGKCDRWPTMTAGDGRELHKVDIDPDNSSVTGANGATEILGNVTEVTF